MTKFTGKQLQQYIDLCYTPKIQELKRLQKEIDEAYYSNNSIIVKGWGNTKNDYESGDYYEPNYELIKSNQSKIKQIIEEL